MAATYVIIPLFTHCRYIFRYADAIIANYCRDYILLDALPPAICDESCQAAIPYAATLLAVKFTPYWLRRYAASTRWLAIERQTYGEKMNSH